MARRGSGTSASKSSNGANTATATSFSVAAPGSQRFANSGICRDSNDLTLPRKCCRLDSARLIESVEQPWARRRGGTARLSSAPCLPSILAGSPAAVLPDPGIVSVSHQSPGHLRPSPVKPQQAAPFTRPGRPPGRAERQLCARSHRQRHRQKEATLLAITRLPGETHALKPVPTHPVRRCRFAA